MHLQGNLQCVFDALFEIGVIDPVLKMDWKEARSEQHLYTGEIAQAVHVVNVCGHDVELLVEELEKFDEKTLTYLAMEVAREFADSHARKELH
jgi:hypothetical protein